MSSPLNRRKFLIYGSAALGTSLLLKGCAPAPSGETAASGESPSAAPAAGSGDTIKVGVLHSLSGTMAISEKSVVDSTLLAIEEINAAGGVGGKKIEAIQEDGASDWPTFAEKAKKLIEQDQVVVIFGCWTSASRKAVCLCLKKRTTCCTIRCSMKGKSVLRTFFTQELHLTSRSSLL
jgi:urea transport system substrate-binding protein